MQTVDLRNIRSNKFFTKAVVFLFSKIVLKKFNEEQKAIFRRVEAKIKKYIISKK